MELVAQKIVWGTRIRLSVS